MGPYMEAKFNYVYTRDLTPEDAWNKCDLFDKLSIENWILPGCFVGIFSTIVWVCPPWSDQVSKSRETIEGAYNYDSKANSGIFQVFNTFK